MGKYTPRPFITKSCLICGDEFQTKNTNYKYCSPECGRVAIKKQQRESGRRYKERNVEKIRARRRQRRLENLEERRKYHAEWMRQWREENGDKSRSAARAYYARNAEARRAYQQEYRRKNEERVAAQQHVARSIRRGDFPSATDHKCVRCDKQATEYHHWSYEREKWFDVEPMCSTCHARADRERIAMESK